MIVDKGYDFPKEIEEKLLGYGEEMWLFRDQPDHPTTRALNSYHGDYRKYERTLGGVRGLTEALVQFQVSNGSNTYYSERYRRQQTWPAPLYSLHLLSKTC